LTNTRSFSIAMRLHWGTRSGHSW